MTGAYDILTVLQVSSNAVMPAAINLHMSGNDQHLSKRCTVCPAQATLGDAPELP